MWKLLFAAGLAGLTLATPGLAPAQTAIVYPWCAHYIGRGMGGAPNCGFATYRQCMAAASGQGANCQRNPAYEDRAMRPSRRDRR